MLLQGVEAKASGLQGQGFVLEVKDSRRGPIPGFYPCLCLAISYAKDPSGEVTLFRFVVLCICEAVVVFL